MSYRSQIYLAGPEVFLASAAEIGRRKKEICAEFGLVGLFPLDGEIKPEREARTTATAIYQANLELLIRADLIVANMTPFRGPSMDVGTAFEMGFMAARGKPVFGYTYAGDSYLNRVRGSGGAEPTKQTDGDGILIEDFGLTDNLMLACAVEVSGELVVRDDWKRAGAWTLEDLTAFRDCIARVARFVADGSHAGAKRHC